MVSAVDKFQRDGWAYQQAVFANVDEKGAAATESLLRNGYIQTHGLGITQYVLGDVVWITALNRRGQMATGDIRVKASALIEMAEWVIAHRDLLLGQEKEPQ